MRIGLVRTLLFSSVAVVAVAIGAFSAEGTKNYDTAVMCKAFSLLSSKAGDGRSTAAIAAIDAEIERDSAETGRTKDQAAADVEYSRYEWVDTKTEQAFLEAEWAECVKRWGG
jgi:hypothetical protein